MGEKKRWVIRGRVQGVGFRWYVSRTAAKLGVRGWARNLSDGSVEVVVEGAVESLRVLREALGRGPVGAVVHGVDQHEVSPELHLPNEFEIR
jgi:acylphosphatase